MMHENRQTICKLESEKYPQYNFWRVFAAAFLDTLSTSDDEVPAASFVSKALLESEDGLIDSRLANS